MDSISFTVPAAPSMAKTDLPSSSCAVTTRRIFSTNSYLSLMSLLRRIPIPSTSSSTTSPSDR